MKQLTQRGLPLYYQIEEQLRTRIDSGEWTEGARIPSEPELAQTYGVSRATIRQAISNLESSGFLRRKQGLGTFVSTPTFKGDYLRFFFPEELGYRHSVLHCSLCESTPSIHRLLQLPFDTQVVELERLRYFRDEYEAHIYEKRCPAGHCRKLLRYTIDPAVCKGCSLCSKVCPVGAISGEVRKPFVIDSSKCIKCGACMEKCRFNAISRK